MERYLILDCNGVQVHETKTFADASDWARAHFGSGHGAQNFSIKKQIDGVDRIEWNATDLRANYH